MPLLSSLRAALARHRHQQWRQSLSLGFTSNLQPLNSIPLQFYKPYLSDAQRDLVLPKVALVGRPNVGKSSLFNRLAGKRVALVHDTPQSHVTRDWRESPARLGDLQFTVVDTCGMEPNAPHDSIQGRATHLTATMLKSAHLALMVIDARSGLVGPDEELASWLSRHFPKQRTLCVMNKAEGKAAHKRMEETEAECYKLGYGNPVAVSASTGEGMADLYVALQPHVDSIREGLMKEHGWEHEQMASMDSSHERHTSESLTDNMISRNAEAVPASDLAGEFSGMTSINAGTHTTFSDLQTKHVTSHEQHVKEATERHAGDAQGKDQGAEQPSTASLPIRLSIVGLPNVGKSTLLNCLLGEARVVTGPEPGLTRDPVAAPLEYKGHKFQLVDTAGYMGSTKVTKYDDVGGDVAQAARGASLAALSRSEIVVLVVDAAAALKSQRVLNHQELYLLSRVIATSRLLVVVANKMDAMPGSREKKLYLDTLKTRLSERLRSGGKIQVVDMSAAQGKGVHKLLPAVLKAHNQWTSRLGTAQLNKWLHEQVLLQSTTTHGGQDSSSSGNSSSGGGGSGGGSGGGILKHLNRIKFVSQVKVAPPTFIAFVAGSQPVPTAVDAYLGNSIRKTFDVPYTPVQFWFRYKQPHEITKTRRVRLRQPAATPTRQRLVASPHLRNQRGPPRGQHPGREASSRSSALHGWNQGDTNDTPSLTASDYLKQRAVVARQQKDGLESGDEGTYDLHVRAGMSRKSRSGLVGSKAGTRASSRRRDDHHRGSSADSDADEDGGIFQARNHRTVRTAFMNEGGDGGGGGYQEGHGNRNRGRSRMQGRGRAAAGGGVGRGVRVTDLMQQRSKASSAI